MDKELDKKLCEDFPLTFRDRHASMKTTCMCWGFPGKGWEPIIREGAEKLEPLIQKHIDETDPVCVCGEPKDAHENGVGKCTTVFEVPIGPSFRWGGGALCPRKGKIDLKRRINLFKWHMKNKFEAKLIRLCRFLKDKFNVHKKVPSKCEQFNLRHPTSSQLKEKYGTMRWYLTDGTDEMYAITDEAETKSETVCEQCGADGELCTSGYWLSTMCDNCLQSDWAKERKYVKCSEVKNETD